MHWGSSHNNEVMHHIEFNVSDVDQISISQNSALRLIYTNKHVLDAEDIFMMLKIVAF